MQPIAGTGFSQSLGLGAGGMRAPWGDVSGGFLEEMTLQRRGKKSKHSPGEGKWWGRVGIPGVGTGVDQGMVARGSHVSLLTLKVQVLFT